MLNIGELMDMMGQFATQEQAETLAKLVESHGVRTIGELRFLDDTSFQLLLPGATVHGDPLPDEMDTIYRFELELPIAIGDRTGTIAYGPGGWGNTAIIVTMDNVRIIARERESEDYVNVERDRDGCFEPDALEVYKWQREDEQPNDTRYYWNVSDALAGHRASRLAF